MRRTNPIKPILCAIVLVVWIGLQFSHAQVDSTFAPKTMQISSIKGVITIDGEFNEATWKQAKVYSGFFEQSPQDGRPASKETEVQIAYDESGIYLAATMYDDPNILVTSLKRDSWGQSDEFAILFDPVNAKANGMAFGVNALGAQTEALLFPNDADDSWDNRWRSATRNYEDRWTLEAYIPFKSLRFEKNNLVWGLQFVRNDPGTNQTHVWSPVPRQFADADFGYFGQMFWDQAPQGQAGNINLIPYVSGLTRKDNANNTTEDDIQIGGDAKIGITRSLNLDLTINPDFSQVEVDNLVTNLTRFSIFFPERRQFFIENSDLFNGFGQFANQPFYSRRIGLDPSGQTV
ncbi:MAG: carbohydrate binding family 9 domain-containing protein, partial [Bacteroidia bacterium]|nr:carbohydrate binding family 9 domain-containing protein [Bacteroidia bacterium]